MLLFKTWPFGVSFRYLGTLVLFSFVVAGIAPTKGLPRDQRLRLLTERARRRYERRQAVVLWFWHWAEKRWGSAPHLVSGVPYSWVRHLRVFRFTRPRISRYARLDGTAVRVVGQHISYEDCVHLYEQALALLLRLERASAT